VEDCFNPADISFFDLEQLCELPGPVQSVMVEETKGEDNAALAVHCHESTVSDPRYKPHKSGWIHSVANFGSQF
jgi:hypothetical protein